MINYVAGLLFNRDRNRVVLIERIKPPGVGLLNGVGGKFEDTDVDLMYTMTREFEEETGVHEKTTYWRQFATLIHNDWNVYWFTAVDSIALSKVRTMHEGRVGVYEVNKVITNYYPIMPNLSFFIPLALDRSGIKKPVELLDIS